MVELNRLLNLEKHKKPSRELVKLSFKILISGNKLFVHYLLLLSEFESHNLFVQPEDFGFSGNELPNSTRCQYFIEYSFIYLQISFCMKFRPSNLNWFSFVFRTKHPCVLNFNSQKAHNFVIWLHVSIICGFRWYNGSTLLPVMKICNLTSGQILI